MLAKWEFTRWKLVAVCAVAQNLALGIAFGSFGPLLASNEAHFETTRTVATIGMSVTAVSVGIFAMLLGKLFTHVMIRTAMMGAAFISAIGYAGLAVLPSIYMALPMYALIGLSISVLGIIGPVALVNRWIQDGRGRALGLINLPIVLVLMPFIVAELLPSYGRTGVLLGLGALFLALIPLLRTFIVDFPGQNDQLPAKSIDAGSRDEPLRGHPEPRRIDEALRRPHFWLVSVGIGIISGTTGAFVVHSVPFALEKAVSLSSAGALLSVFAAGGLVGAPLLGWIVDRLGGPLTLAVSAACQAALWASLPFGDLGMLYPLAALLGMCAAPINVLHQATMSELLTPDSVSRGIGISYLVKLPFLFSMPPLVSVLFEQSAGYQFSFIVMAGALVVACLCFLAAVVGRAERRTFSEAAPSAE
jgi:predicted MFS family arabinose efflux permease